MMGQELVEVYELAWVLGLLLEMVLLALLEQLVFRVAGLPSPLSDRHRDYSIF